MVEGPNGGSYTFTNGCPYNSGTGAGGYYGQIDSTSYGYVNVSTTTTFWYILPPLDLANPTRFLYISDSHGISCNLGVSFRREPIVGNTTQDRVIISYNANNPQYFTIPNGPFLIDKNNDLMIHTMFGNQISDLRACSYSVLDSKCNNVIQSGVNP